MSNLNKDILFLIFEEFQDDSKSLFSCLMVNRFWCEIAISILWKNPWHYNINYSNKYYLFAIIGFYLSNDIREFLMKEGIRLPLISSQSLLFDYLSFCRSIDINIINTLISIGSSLDYDQFLIQQEFYSLFMKKFLGLKFLDIRSLNHQIFYCPEAKTCLESLCELKCNTSIDSSYFYGFASICQHIQRLIIINENQNFNGIVKLIEVQKNLKYFEWKDDFDNDYFPTEKLYKDIFFELEKKANTLNHFKLFFDYEYFTEYMFPQNLLPKLHKLKTLVINDFSYVDENLLKGLVYNNLEILNIGYTTMDEASILIENSGGKLKQILLKPVDYDYQNESSLNFIRNIYKNCPSIECLSLAFPPYSNHFTEFKRLLNTCHNLKSLLLVIKNGYHIYETEEKMIENGSKLLKILIESTTNLREIRFFNDFKFSLKDLKEFLRNWSGRPALSLLTSDHIYERNDYKTLIDEYKDAGIIKDFRCESVANLENMDFKT
ncbi:hypothetical protein RclHR1_03680001 [Rhizophagus clarus]|uniref:F-box domain-containing protein n=1 Tax=Rhizophagus clarus TaxID=94130 RepID=A0A2Z6S6M9_9GLOM|nr:hypothetical protein RclHR1_03680001 [Rhizophagus clarus]GES76428.1 hypothetical protein GLOIN_2v1764020 [Rhizophagus clarus]